MSKVEQSKKPIVYCGSHGEVSQELALGVTVNAKRGETIEVEPKLYDELISRSGEWKAPKDAVKAKGDEK